VTAAFALEEVDGLLLVRCRALAGIPGILHAFSTAREGGSAGFDLGTAHAGDPSVQARRERFLAAAGFPGCTAAIVRQVHGTRVVRASDTASEPEADGVAWRSGEPVGRIPAVRTADCVPILMAERRGRAAAALHAGWRGAAARMASKAVEELAAGGIPPSDLVAALGPAILGCCYEIGWEVEEALGASVPAGRGGDVSRTDSRGRIKADLHAAIRWQLVASGVPEGAIHCAPWCTRCRADLFHSYRRQGANAGRMMACIGPAVQAPRRGDP
jgi:hypothetical protein